MWCCKHIYFRIRWSVACRAVTEVTRDHSGSKQRHCRCEIWLQWEASCAGSFGWVVAITRHFASGLEYGMCHIRIFFFTLLLVIFSSGLPWAGWGYSPRLWDMSPAFQLMCLGKSPSVVVLSRNLFRSVLLQTHALALCRKQLIRIAWKSSHRTLSSFALQPAFLLVAQQFVAF